MSEAAILEQRRRLYEIIGLRRTLDCGHFADVPHGVTPQYSIDGDTHERICHDCAAYRALEQMIDDGSIVLGIHRQNHDGAYMLSHAGSHGRLSFRTNNVATTRKATFGATLVAYFNGPDNHIWVGRAWGCYPNTLLCRRTRRLINPNKPSMAPKAHA